MLFVLQLLVKIASLNLPLAHKSPAIWKWKKLKDQAHIQEGLTQKMAYLNTFFCVYIWMHAAVF